MGLESHLEHPHGSIEKKRPRHQIPEIECVKPVWQSAVMSEQIDVVPIDISTGEVEQCFDTKEKSQSTSVLAPHPFLHLGGMFMCFCTVAK